MRNQYIQYKQQLECQYGYNWLIVAPSEQIKKLWSYEVLMNSQNVTAKMLTVESEQMSDGPVRIAHIQTKEEKDKSAFQEGINLIPQIVDLHHAIFLDMRSREGYTDAIAIDFANKYILQLIQGGTKDDNS